MVPLNNRSVDTRMDNMEKKGIRACASRPLAARGKVGMLMSLSEPVALNFASCDVPKLHVHKMDEAHLCSAKVQLVAMATQGGQWGSTISDQYNPQSAVFFHAIGMTLVWVLLIPAGECNTNNLKCRISHF
jgi:hypothetical protein